MWSDYPSNVVLEGDVLRIYLSGAIDEHAQIRGGPASRQGDILLHTQRRNAFANLEPDAGTSELVTRSLLWAGAKLRAASYAFGSRLSKVRLWKATASMTADFSRVMRSNGYRNGGTVEESPRWQVETCAFTRDRPMDGTSPSAAVSLSRHPM